MKRIWLSLFLLVACPLCFAARLFNGTSDFILITPAASEFEVSADYTIAIKFKITAHQDNRIISQWDDGTGKDVLLLATASDGTGNIYMEDFTTGSVRTRALGSFSLATWYSFVGRISAGHLDIWLDGVKLGGSDSEAFVNSSGVTGVPFKIGGASNGGSLTGPFHGEVAEVAFWNGATLSDNDCRSVSIGYSPLRVKYNVLTGYWPLVGRKSPEVSAKIGTVTATLTGTTQSPHPRTIP